jgi:hypothetical protein
LKQDQEIAMDVLSVSIELHTKKEERLTRSYYPTKLSLPLPKLSLPLPNQAASGYT